MVDYITYYFYWLFAIGSFAYGAKARTTPYLFFTIACFMFMTISVVSWDITRDFSGSGTLINNTVVITTVHYAEPSASVWAEALMWVSGLFAILYLLESLQRVISASQYAPMRQVPRMSIQDTRQYKKWR